LLLTETTTITTKTNKKLAHKHTNWGGGNLNEIKQTKRKTSNKQT